MRPDHDDRTKIGAGCSSPHHLGDLWRLALAFSCSPSGSRSPTLVRLGGTVSGAFRVHPGSGGEMLPVINKVGGSVDRVNGQLDKVDRITDSAVDAADSVDTAVRAVSLAMTRPVQKLSGLPRRHHAASDFKAQPRLAHAVRRARKPPRGASGSPRRAARRGRRMTDEIRLVLPRRRTSRPIAHLVTRRPRHPARPDVRGPRRPAGRARRAARAA